MYVQAGTLFLGVLLGGMGLVSFLIGPLAFRALPEDMAGRFVRAMFPHYYAFVIGASALATVGCVGHGPVSAKIMAVVTLVAVFLRQWLTPRLNRWRDAALAGDAAAKRSFDWGHRASVGLNFAQMAAALVALVLYV